MEGGLKTGRPGGFPRELDPRRRGRMRPGSRNGRPEQFEGPGGAPAFREIGALQEDLAGIDDGGIQGGQVGRRQHPGQASGVKIVTPPPAGRGDDRQVAVDGLGDVVVAGQLPQAEAVAHGQGVRPHEEAHSGRSRLPSTATAPMGLGRSNTTTFFPQRRRGLHDLGQGGGKGVDPGAHVHEVHQNRVHHGQGLGRRGQRGP